MFDSGYEDEDVRDVLYTWMVLHFNQDIYPNDFSFLLFIIIFFYFFFLLQTFFSFLNSFYVHFFFSNFFVFNFSPAIAFLFFGIS